MEELLWFQAKFPGLSKWNNNNDYNDPTNDQTNDQ